MKEPLEKIRLGDNHCEHRLTISIYEEYVKIEVGITINESANALKQGGVPAERVVLNSFLYRIFKEPYENLKMFSSKTEAVMWQNSFSFEIDDLSHGGWSKTAFIILNSTNYEASLDAALTYVKASFNHFINPREKLQKIAKSIISKYFK